MDASIEKVISGTPQCFGAFYVCAGYKSKCRKCTHSVQCAKTALKMYLAVQSNEIILDNLQSNRVTYLRDVGIFLPDDYLFPENPLKESDLELAKICHTRSKHLISIKPTFDEMKEAIDSMYIKGRKKLPKPTEVVLDRIYNLLDQEDLDFLDDELEKQTEPKEICKVKSAKAFMPKLRPVESDKEAVPTLVSTGQPIIAEVESVDNVVPSFPILASTSASPSIKLPIDSWERNKIAMAALSDEVLAERVITLSLQRALSGVGLVPYIEIRDEFCALNIEINFRKKFAPRFREMRRPAYAFDMSKDEMLLRDRIVFDLHWLHCRSVRKTIKLPGSVDPAFASLLRTSEFDFDAAWRFACLDKKMATRASWLKLNDDIAWQLATIESAEMNKRFYTIMQGEKRKGMPVQIGYYDVLAILESSVPNRLKPNIPTWATIWMCNRILRTGGKEPTMTDVTLLHAVATGRDTPLDRKDIKQRLDSCERYILEYSRTSKLAA